MSRGAEPYKSKATLGASQAVGLARRDPHEAAEGLGISLAEQLQGTRPMYKSPSPALIPAMSKWDLQLKTQHHFPISVSAPQNETLTSKSNKIYTRKVTQL